LDGVYTVRTLADVDRMQPEFRPGARLVVIGGGYIGLEAAAVARKLGLEVTLVEAAPRILGRVACAETADAIRALHQTHGVTIREGVGVARITGDTRANGVELATGEVLAADFVIVGIGVLPAVALAEAAGLVIENGIAVDPQGRTSDPHIWAAGDCASFDLDGTRIRIESVGNAIDMAELVAENMLGAGRDYVPKPWFWSDQFDAKLQIAGLNTDYDQIVTRDDDGQSFWYFREGRLIAVDALNDAKAYMVGKRLIEGGKLITPEALTNATVLRDLMK
jgi:3-phenylpropionate/trans-cinnamate dioxygenase ferredoxin reductase subunit